MVKNKKNQSENSEHWLKAYWRPAMAFTYMWICIFDFFIMPAWVAHVRVKPIDAVELAKKMPEKDQIMALTVLTKESAWDPLTLKENGFFHISMMAILGVSAWTRGREKQILAGQQTQDPNQPNNSPTS